MSDNLIRIFHNIEGPTTQNLWIKILCRLTEKDAYWEETDARLRLIIQDLVKRSSELVSLDLVDRFTEEFLEVRESGFSNVTENPPVASGFRVMIYNEFCSIISAPASDKFVVADVIRAACLRWNLPTQIVKFTTYHETTEADCYGGGAMVIDKTRGTAFDGETLARLWAESINNAADPASHFLRRCSSLIPDVHNEEAWAKMVSDSRKKVERGGSSPSWPKRWPAPLMDFQ